MAELLDYQPTRQLALHAECEHRAIAFKATSGMANEPTAAHCGSQVSCEEKTREREHVLLKIKFRRCGRMTRSDRLISLKSYHEMVTKIQ